MPSENPIPEHKPEPDTQAKAAKQGNATSNEIKKTAALSKSDSEKTYSHCQITCKQERDWIDHLKTVAEFAGLILLGIYTGYTIKMYCANKQAADAATKAADVADKTLKSGQRATWLEQRAWVSFVAADTPTLRPNQAITLSMRLENTGRTPAEKVNGDIIFEIFRKGEEKTFRHPRTEVAHNFDAGILVPGHRTLPPLPAMNQRTGQIERYTSEVANSLASGAFIMAHGKVNYIDAWRVNHQLKFCVVVFGQTPRDFTGCQEYGEIDHNEPQEPK